MILSQRHRNASYGCESYQVVVTIDDDELVHEYCLYSSQAGPVRPHPVKSLQVEQEKGSDTWVVTWWWSENSYDRSAPGAYFKKAFIFDEDGKMKWTARVVRSLEPLN